MRHIPKVNTLKELEALPGKPLPVSVYAMMAQRSRNTIYQKIERGTLPACHLGGLLCVVVSPRLTEDAANPHAS